MPQWLVIVLVVAALAVAYKFFIHKRGPGMPLAKAKGPSKKSRWRRLAGNAVKMAAPSIPGMGQALQVGGALGAGV